MASIKKPKLKKLPKAPKVPKAPKSTANANAWVKYNQRLDALEKTYKAKVDAVKKENAAIQKAYNDAIKNAASEKKRKADAIKNAKNKRTQLAGLGKI